MDAPQAVETVQWVSDGGIIRIAGALHGFIWDFPFRGSMIEEDSESRRR
jgi:hypothetical protein